jgi:steroid delta-isomerase-like uncharacterized protein
MGPITEFETRRANTSDAYDMALAHRDSIRSMGPAFYPPQTVDDWEEAVSPQMYVTAMARGEVFFIATGNVDAIPLVLGFASDYGIEGSTHGASVYVRGVAVRRRIGTALFRLAEAHALATGATRIQVEASLAGTAFYTANGFIEVGRGEIHLRSGRPIACVFMVKELHGAPAEPRSSHGVDQSDEGLWQRQSVASTVSAGLTNENKNLVRRWIAFANSGFSGSFAEFIAQDYIGHLGATEMDARELERIEREFCAAFPDAQHSVDDLIATDDRVVLRTTTRATHRGDFQGIAGTDRAVEFTGLVIYRIREGKIVESCGEIDFLRLMRQLRA